MNTSLKLKIDIKFNSRLETRTSQLSHWTVADVFKVIDAYALVAYVEGGCLIKIKIGRKAFKVADQPKTKITNYLENLESK